MNLRDWRQALPEKPGSSHLKSGHVRLYHQTLESSLDSIARDILNSSKQDKNGEASKFLIHLRKNGYNSVTAFLQAMQVKWRKG